MASLLYIMLSERITFKMYCEQWIKNTNLIRSQAVQCYLSYQSPDIACYSKSRHPKSGFFVCPDIEAYGYRVSGYWTITVICLKTRTQKMFRFQSIRISSDPVIETCLLMLRYPYVWNLGYHSSWIESSSIEMPM